MLTGCASSMGRAPYKQLLTHGFVVDQNGRKMSKSIGNVVAPQEVYNEFGADILRLWAASTDYSGELAISKEILKRVTESYRRIRNTLSFLFANLSDFNPIEDAVQQADMVEIDRYAVVLARQLQERLAGDYYPRYAFHFAVKDIVSFCSEDLGRVLPRYPERPPLHHKSKQPCTPQRANCPVSHHTQFGSADCSDFVLHRRGSMGHHRWRRRR